MPASARADSSGKARPAASSRPPFNSKLRMAGRQNSRVGHGELEEPQRIVLLQLIGELIGERGGVGFAVDRDLPRSLIISGDVDVLRRKALEEVEKNLHGIVA